MQNKFLQTIPPPPSRPDDGHKGTFGTVLIVGGSRLMPGAPALCATAALRSGAGLVRIAAPREVLPAVLGFQASATGVDLDEVDELRGDEKVVVAIGPGLGREVDIPRRVESFLSWPNPLVVDADGLNALGDCPTISEAVERATSVKRAGPWVLTPHPGEFRTLAKVFGLDADPTAPDQRPAAARALAAATGAVVVLKGRHTIVTDGVETYRNNTGNVVLATGGSGDVLTGLIAGLLAQKMSPLDAAVLGVHAHGRAADAWATDHGPRGMLAMELADRLPAALRDLAEGV